MATDPAPFLSTIVGTSAGLVAIVGGLLVARFVSLDSDQRGNRKILIAASERLASARQRAADARRNLVAWHATAFFNSSVTATIGQGNSDLDVLKRLADWSFGDAELRPFVTEVVEEFARAREALADRISASDDEWDTFRRITPDLPEIRWPHIWKEATRSRSALGVEFGGDPVDLSLKPQHALA